MPAQAGVPSLSMCTSMRPAAIIPAYNCAGRIRAVVERCSREVTEVVVVDDGSTDGTADELRGLSRRGLCVALRHPENRGKGAALRTGLRYLRRRAPDMVVFLDGDGEHDPADIPRLISALKDAGLAVGCRGAYRSPARKALNAWMALWMRMVVPGVRDPSCGLRAARWSLLECMELASDDFCIDAEMVLEARRLGARMTSVPVACGSRAPSTLRPRDYLAVNAFYDSWVVRHAKDLKLPAVRRLTLEVACRLGQGLSALALRCSRK